MGSVAIALDSTGAPAVSKQLRSADVIVKTMLSSGVDRVFGIPGGAISGVFDAMIASEIDVVICQHEQMAAYLAYGHARATGRPAAVAVTAGPGVLNTLTSVAAAYKDEVPVLVIAGDVRTPVAGMGALQDGGERGLDIITMVKNITKFADTLRQPERAVALVAGAIKMSMSHPRGPVFLRMPLDTTLEVVPTDPVRQADILVSEPDSLICDEIADALASAAAPAILLGIGARMAKLGPSILTLAQRLRCPVICDVEAKGLFPEGHSLSLGLFGIGGNGASAAYLRRCDALLTVGARLDDTTTNGFSELLQPRDGFLAQLDHDERRLGRAYDPTVRMACDLQRAMTEIESRVGLPSPSIVVRREFAILQARGVVTPPLGVVPTRAPFDPRSIVSVLQAAMPADTIWTSDIGNHLLVASRYLTLDEPGRFHASVGLGGMGSGIGVAMGMAMAHGSAQSVVGICGDGSLRMVGSEIATCAKYNIPVVLAVFNDSRFGMVAHGMEKVYGRVAWCDSPEVDVVQFAQSLGARAIRIEAVEDFQRAAAMVGAGPLVLDIPIDPDVRISNPRNESLAH